MRDARPKIAALIVDIASGRGQRSTSRRSTPLYQALERPTQSTHRGQRRVTLKSKIGRARDGASAYDLKTRSSNARRVSKSGVPYVDVPFTHTTSGTRGMRLPSSVKDDQRAADRDVGRGAARAAHAGQRR